MPIVIACTGCNTKLSAPDSAVGKHIRCPKPGCGAIIPIPAPPEPEAEEPITASLVKSGKPDADDEDRKPSRKRRDDDDEDAARPRSRKRRDDDDDEDERPRRRHRDDDDDEDDRPRRRKRGAEGRNGPKIMAIILISFLGVGGIGYGVYRMIGGSIGGAAPPPGWKEFTYRDDNFKAYFPKEPQVSRMGDVMNLGGGANPFGGAGGNPFAGGGGGAGGSVNVYTVGGSNDAVFIQIMVTRIPGGVPSAMRDGMTRGIEQSQKVLAGTGMEVRSVRWLGEKAVEISSPGGVMRSVATDKAVYQASISRPNFTRATAAEEAGFFDNFVLVR